MSLRLAMCFFLLAASGSAAVAADDCRLPSSFSQTDVCNQGEQGDEKKRCWRSVLYDDESIIFSEQFRINTDGNIRSYSAVDPAGNKCATLPGSADPYKSGCAMNSVCNGLRVKYPDGRVLCGVAGECINANCPALLKEFERIRDSGWNSSEGASIVFGNVIRTIGVDEIGKKTPCLVDGYMISMAAARSGLPERGRCDQGVYLDSDIPSVVVPRCWSRAFREKNRDACLNMLSSLDFPYVEPGDFAVVQLRATPRRVIMTIVGDSGPNYKIGEASVGLMWRLRNKKGLPRTQQETYALDGGDLFNIVIFPGTAAPGAVITPETFAGLQKKIKAVFTAWGSGQNTAAKRLSACGSAVR